MKRFTCPSCGNRLKYVLEHSGKKARCPKCRHLLQIPQLSEVAAIECQPDVRMNQPNTAVPSQTSRRILKLRKGTLFVVIPLIPLLLVVNFLLVRTRTLQTYRLQPRVVLLSHGWPLPAASIIIKNDLPDPRTDSEYPFVGLVHVEDIFLPEGVKMSNDGNITFENGSKFNINRQWLLMDAVVWLVVLVLITAVCEFWVFKPAAKG